jgi:hypothetical protein
MAKELSMNGRKKIETIQREFSEKFNYLTLIFLNVENKSIDVSKSLSEVRTKKGPDISIIGSLKVNTLEKRFNESFGLKVEVAYSKDGKVFHTKDSVDKTLNELNSWCGKNGCEKFEFKKKLTRNTLMSVQEQLFNTIKEEFPDAIAKKINKDNFMDVHLPSVNPKRGTHLFFNTAKDGIKFGFYCRDEHFNNPILERSTAVEAYAQGIRPEGNPIFDNLEEASGAAIAFIHELTGLSGIKSIQNSNPVIAAFVSEWQENPDSICQLLDSLGTQEGKMRVYNVDIDVLSSLNPEDVPEVDDLEFMGEVEINDWDGLSEIIGVHEAEVNKKEYTADNLSDTSKIVFLYSSGEYVYSFYNPGDENI